MDRKIIRVNNTNIIRTFEAEMNMTIRKLGLKRFRFQLQKNFTSSLTCQAYPVHTLFPGLNACGAYLKISLKREAIL